MSLKLSDLEIKTKLPAVPQTLPVFGLVAPSFEERRPAIARLGEHLKLGALRPVAFEHGTVLASPRGEVTFFEASGAVLARDAFTDQQAVNEFRKWDGVVDSKVDGFRAALSPDAGKRLIGQVRELLQPLRLIGAEVASETVQLEQVSQLDSKGNEIARGAGTATVKFSYALGGVPVRGAGGKTLAFAVPESGQPRVTGMFHAWRTIGQSASVRLGSVEEALSVGVLADPELERYRAAGHRIEVSRLEFVYLALPAFMRQSHLLPAFQVEGTVSEGPIGISFRFGRFHHAASARAYAAADLFGPYLSGNPDGIAATASVPVLV